MLVSYRAVPPHSDTMKTLPTSLCATALLCLLNSCYFNSAGHIFDKASHDAAVDMADLKPNSTVYADGSKYYVELPRYRAGKPVRTQYSVGEQKQLQDKLRKTNDTTMVEIPRDFAMYLTGKHSGNAVPTYVRRATESPADIKQRSSTLTTTIAPKAYRFDFRHTSPAAAGWYTLGVLDWLCVDLPITCVENSLAICGISIMLLNEAAEEAKRNPSAGYDGPTTVSSSSSEAQYRAYEAELYQKDQAARREWINAGNSGYDYQSPYGF